MAGLLGTTLLNSCSSITDRVGLKCTGKLKTEDLYERVKSSVAVINSDNSQGSGFVVKHKDGQTFILTNSHVVQENQEVNVKWENRLIDKGYLVGDLGGHELTKDLALIKVNGKRGKPLNFRDSEPKIGSDVIVVGAPKGLEFSLTKGVISQIREQGDFVQIDAPVNPGNSGGPVIDESGCVVGVVTFKKEDAESLNFGISTSIAKQFLENPINARRDSDELILTGTPKPFPSKPPKVPSFHNADGTNGNWTTYWNVRNFDEIPKRILPRIEKLDKNQIMEQPYNFFRTYQYRKDSITVDNEWIWLDHRQVVDAYNDDDLIRPVGVNCLRGNLYFPSTYEYEYEGPQRNEYWAREGIWIRKMGITFWGKDEIEYGSFFGLFDTDYWRSKTIKERKERLEIMAPIYLLGSLRLYTLFNIFCDKGNVKKEWTRI